MNINLLDAGLCIVLVLCLVRGLLRGMVRELVGLVSIILGFLLAGRLYPQLTPHLHAFIPNEPTASIVAYLTLFIAVFLLVTLFAAVLRKFMTLTFTSWLDYLLGGIAGTAKGLLLCALALALLERLTPASPLLKDSLLAQHIAQATALARAYLPAFL